MTDLLQKAFEKFSQFSDEQQNIIAKALLAVDEIHPEFGPIISGNALFEQHEITQDDIKADRSELGIE